MELWLLQENVILHHQLDKVFFLHILSSNTTIVLNQNIINTLTPHWISATLWVSQSNYTFPFHLCRQQEDCHQNTQFQFYLSMVILPIIMFTKMINNFCFEEPHHRNASFSPTFEWLGCSGPPPSHWQCRSCL